MEPHKSAGNLIGAVLSKGTVSKKQLIKNIVEKSGLSDAQAEAFLVAYNKTAEELILMGHDLPFGNLLYLHLGVRGVFDANGLPLEGKAPEFRINIVMQPALRKILGQVPYTTKRRGPKLPIPMVLEDISGQERNTVLTRGGIAKLFGDGLKFHPLMGDEGLYLVPVNAGEGVGVVKVTHFSHNKNTELDFQTPDGVQEGEAYYVEIRKRFPKTKILRAARLAEAVTIL